MKWHALGDQGLEEVRPGTQECSITPRFLVYLIVKGRKILEGWRTLGQEAELTSDKCEKFLYPNKPVPPPKSKSDLIKPKF